MPTLPAFLTRAARIPKSAAPKETPAGSAEFSLSIRQTVKNFLVTRDGVVLAGYRIGPQRQNFIALPQRILAHNDVADGWANLAVDGGRDVIERVTTKPHPVRQWAQRLDARTPNRLPDVHVCDGINHAKNRPWTKEELHKGFCGCETYFTFMQRPQRRMAGTGMDDKVVFRYFEVGNIPARLDLAAQLKAKFEKNIEPHEDVKRLLVAEGQTFSAVRGPGWNAKRMTQREQTWLRHRSMAPGIPAPSLADPEYGLEADDFRAELYDIRHTMDGGLDRSTKVVAFRNGKPISRAVQVLTAVSANDMVWPENGLEPWQVFAERVRDSEHRSFGVEWLIAGRLYPGADLSSRATLDLRKARSVRDGYAEHGEEPPPVIGRGIRRAVEVHDEVTQGKPSDATRLVGTINAVVTGEDVFKDGKLVKTAEEVAYERGEAFMRLMAGNAMRWEFTVPTAQAAKLKEFIPGEEFDTRGFIHTIPAKYLAAGMPNATARVGDGFGPYIGFTQGATRRPVMHDSHYATEGRGALGRKANLWIVVGSLGAGKSVLLIIEATNCVRRGITTVVNDPAGRMGPVLSLPEIAPFAIERNMAKAARGELSPYVMVPRPQKRAFAIRDDKGELLRDEDGKPLIDEDAYRQAVSTANTERAMLGRDIARMALPSDLYRAPRTEGLLRKASRAHGVWTAKDSLFDLADEVRKLGEDGEEIYEALMEASEAEYLRTLFAPRGQGGDFLVKASKRHTLELITTPGLRRAPDELSREEWTPQMLAAEPMLHLAALHTVNVGYDKDRKDRATLIFDEADNLATSKSGRGMMNRIGRDHSGNNLEVIFASQNIAGVGAIENRNYIAGGWAGQMKSRAEAEELLPYMNVEDKGYADTLLNLSRTEPGEFVHWDADGNVEVMKADIPDQRLAELAFTNPNPEGASAWADDEEELG